MPVHVGQRTRTAWAERSALTQHDVTQQLVVRHLDVSDGDTQAENLLELELDRRAHLVDLVGEILVVSDGSRELASCGLSSVHAGRTRGARGRTLGKTRAQQTRDLLDESLGGQEGVVLLGELLDKLLVLVEFLQVVDGHVLEVDLLGAVDVGGVSENADGHAGAGDIGEPSTEVRTTRTTHKAGLDALDGARETLVSLGVVVLETNLELDGLDKVTLLLAVGIGEELLDRAPHA